MIVLHKLNGDKFSLNASHVETIEERPDTVITLINDRKYLVLEPMDEVVKKIIDYFEKIHININRISIDGEDEAHS